MKTHLRLRNNIHIRLKSSPGPKNAKNTFASMVDLNTE